MVRGGVGYTAANTAASRCGWRARLVQLTQTMAIAGRTFARCVHSTGTPREVCRAAFGVHTAK